MTNIGFLTLKPKALLNHKNLALLIKKICLRADRRRRRKFFEIWRIFLSASIRQHKQIFLFNNYFLENSDFLRAPSAPSYFLHLWKFQLNNTDNI